VPNGGQAGTFLFDFAPDRGCQLPLWHILVLQRAYLAAGGHILMRFRARSLFFCGSGHILAAQRAHSAVGEHIFV
jgi:hypothetical protein